MKRCAIVGFANTTVRQAPYDNPDWEIWTLNDAYTVVEADEARTPIIRNAVRWFDMHTFMDLNRWNERMTSEYGTWLRQEHEFPIYMRERFDDFPSSVRYPQEEVVRYLGQPYFSSSIAYMFALAMYEGYEEIGIWGVEMSHDTEYGKQRPNMEWLIGLAQGRGIKVVIPKMCSLLRDRSYGYEDEAIVIHTMISMRRDHLEDIEKQNLADLNFASGEETALQELYDYLLDAKAKGEHPDLAKTIVEALKAKVEKHLLARDTWQTTCGALQEVEGLSAWHAGQTVPSARIHPMTVRPITAVNPEEVTKGVIEPMPEAALIIGGDDHGSNAQS